MGTSGPTKSQRSSDKCPRPYSARTSPSLPPLSRVFCLSEVMSRLKITRSAIAGGPTAWPDSKYITSHVFYIHRQVFESNHSLHYDSYISRMNETLKWLEYRWSPLSSSIVISLVFFHVTNSRCALRLILTSIFYRENIKLMPFFSLWVVHCIIVMLILLNYLLKQRHHSSKE